MAKARSYKLLCPIARALDRIGDRWTLLILRDLHAGPARFSDLQRGLTGIAANLLTERLAKLADDGLIEKQDAGHGTTVYELTDLGRQTGNVIFELAMFGGQFKPEVPTVKPGNLRTVATTLGAAARRIPTDDLSFRAELRVDGEAIDLQVENGTINARYSASANPDLIFTTGYEALLAMSEGEMEPNVFLRDHADLDVKTPGKDAEFLMLMTRVTDLLTG
ncbi:winged helix-turn-helix transcriptional regulator [Roseibium sp.]|uniref:winged helix-turn-helix transcriptional regulator n=1 Tax=Roseibium sp. TaxID=1936156 RepID=UPI003B52F6CE